MNVKDMPEYGVWRGMKRRCLDPRRRSWPFYGGRGITVCARWNSSFAAFLVDMGRRPSPEHSIDRIDNDGDYEPGNCQWTTRDVQGKNRRNNLLIEFNGKRQTGADWSRELGMRSTTVVANRLNLGWSVERALTERVGRRRTKAQMEGK